MESEDDMMTQRGNLKKIASLFFIYLCYLARVDKMENRYNKENVRE